MVCHGRVESDRMRVISGKAKGTILKPVPGMGTRPTTDKVKEAIFSIIGPYFDGGYALDLFAGTGGLGIEALSRGVDRCVFIDLEPKCADIVRRNLEAAKLVHQAEVYRNDADRVLKLLAKHGFRFDLVFLDPPYRFKRIPSLLAALQELDLLAPEAIVVAEHDAADEQPERSGRLAVKRRAEYGDTAVTVYLMRADDGENGADGGRAVAASDAGNVGGESPGTTVGPADMTGGARNITRVRAGAASGAKERPIVGRVDVLTSPDRPGKRDTEATEEGAADAQDRT